MSVLEFVASLVRSLAWPFAIALALVLFRSQIRGLITNVSEFRAGKFRLTVRREVQLARVEDAVAAAEVSAEAESVSAVAEVASGAGTVLLPQLQSSLGMTPTERVSESFAMVVGQLREAVKATGDAPVSGLLAEAVRIALDRDLITQDTAVGIRSLETLFILTKAATVTPEEALEFSRLAMGLVHSIKRDPPAPES